MRTHGALHRRVALTGLSTVVVATALMISACTGTDSFGVATAKSTAPPQSTSTTQAADCAEMLPPAAQASQLLMVMVASPSLATDALSRGTVGGFGLKGAQPANIAELVTAATQNAPLEPFVAADEEGGIVQRLTAAIGKLPAAATLGAGTVEAAQEAYRAHNTAMKNLGFNMNFAPSADVGTGSALGTRTYGSDPTKVSQFVVAAVDSATSAGLIPVVKHWPGIGGGNADPHVKLTTLAPLEQLQAKDLLPFQAAFAAKAPAVMVTHAVIPGLTEPGVPASLSTAAINGELRGREGFKGLVITDSLGMGAVVSKFPQPQAAVQAIAAGADVALLSGGEVVDAAHQALTDAITSKQIPRNQVLTSVRRVLKLKGVSGPCIGVVSRFAAAQNDSTASPDCNDATSSGQRASSGSSTSNPRSSTTTGLGNASTNGASGSTRTTECAPADQTGGSSGSGTGGTGGSSGSTRTTIDSGINSGGTASTTSVKRSSVATLPRTSTTLKRSSSGSSGASPDPTNFDNVPADPNNG